MPIIDTGSGEALLFKIEKVLDRDFEWIAKSSEFDFDWGEERLNEIYKIYLLETAARGQILGLMSLVDIPQEYRVHLNLIEVGLSNRRAYKALDHIAGCLIAYACRLAFIRDYYGFVSLQPKTKLIALYQSRYGFRQYGRLLAVDQDASRELIQKFLPDEEE